MIWMSRYQIYTDVIIYPCPSLLSYVYWDEGYLDETWWDHIDGLVQERRNSSALAMELRLSCTNPSISWTNVWSVLIKVNVSDSTEYME